MSVSARTQAREIATPDSSQSGGPLGAEAAFRARLAELGATLLEPAWLGAREPHRVRCAAGHECAPRPSSVQQGRGICLACVGRGGTTAWDAFQARVAELGGVVLEPAWLGHKRPHRVRCASGHECAPWPSSLQQGRNLCKACGGGHPDRSRMAEATFRTLVAELGGVVLEPTWLGIGTPHRVRCAAGHECAPQPRSLNYLGRGICRTCAGLGNPATAWGAFRARVAELGGEVLEPVWLGSKKPHRVRCAAGHDCSPRPDLVQTGQGLCRRCADRHGSDEAWSTFRASVARLGGTVVEPAWLGSLTPHRVRCAAGHECAPRPANVTTGHGICRRCAGTMWDVFYVVVDDLLGHLKFGITSGDPRGRLSVHRRHGYRTAVRVLADLPGTVAPNLERDVIATLRLAGEQPIHGREYYDIHVLATVLDIVDNYPGVPGRGALG